MKTMKKALLSMLVLGALFIFMSTGIQAHALGAYKGSYKLAYLDSKELSSASFDVKDNYTTTQVALCNAKGKVSKTTVCSFYASFDGLKKNQVYYYKARGVEHAKDASGRYLYDENNKPIYEPVTNWGPIRCFTTIVPTVKFSGLSAIFKFPKKSGVKNYVLYVSNQGSTKGYKKVATLKPGKNWKMTKFAGKSFAYYKNYYFKFVPTTTTKRKADQSLINYFYFRKVYR